MQNNYPTKYIVSYGVPIIGFILMPAIWIALKQFGHISDRYLPAPVDVIRAATEIDPNLAIHVTFTAARLLWASLFMIQNRLPVLLARRLIQCVQFQPSP